ncbi:histone deacetylase 5-like [Triticum urartu]|uniref:Histone deacetylase domain-containing protein n=1 Tax=Triticum urartu TaxID=4572 RepID=A0A8R7QGJ7_TRIUA|nr:histone deacetylase 5-like [Triticum urartu]
MSPAASTAIPTINSRSLRRTPARAARAAHLDAASQHCHEDEAATEVEDIIAGTNCKGKMPLNAGAEIQNKAQSSYLSLSRPLSSHTLPKVKQIFGDVSWKGARGKSFEGEKKISTVALITDEDMLLHESADTHNENPARLISIMSNLRKGKLINRCDLFKPDEIGVKYMLDVHSSTHVKDIVSIATKNQNQRDNLALKHCSKGDMYYSQGSTRAALLAAGGSVKACTLAVEGMYKYAFALVRPPGHHAGLRGPSGFCLLNNVAVGAMHLLNKYQMKKIVILDWDIHHGNGTQKIFYKDNRVLVISVHRYGGGFYPDSSEGNTEHIGEGVGRGFNANICFTHNGIRDVDYITVWEHLVMPVISEFDPEIVLISAGFDAAEGDDLGQCKVTPNGFATLLQMLMKFDRLVMVLEGGYNLDALSESVSACIEVLLGEKSCIPLDRTILPYSTTWEAIIETRKVLKPFWDACKPDIPEGIRSKSIPYVAQKTTD